MGLGQEISIWEFFKDLVIRLEFIYLYGVFLRDNVCFMCLFCFKRLIFLWEVRFRNVI